MDLSQALTQIASLERTLNTLSTARPDASADECQVAGCSETVARLATCLMRWQDLVQQSTCPPAPGRLQQLPADLLRPLLRHAGPHTRRVCRQFRAIFGGLPAALHLRDSLGGPSAPAAAAGHAAALQRMPCVPAVQHLTVPVFPTLPPDGAYLACPPLRNTPAGPTDLMVMAAQVVASRATCLRELHLEDALLYTEIGDGARDPRPLTNFLLAVLRCFAATSLETLSGVRVSVIRAPWSAGQEFNWSEEVGTEAAVQLFDSPLLQLTALRSLHVLSWQSAPVQALTRLSLLTRLAFHPCASVYHSTTPFLRAAAQLPSLLSLDLPADDVSDEVTWHDAGLSLRRSLTQLTHLQVGSSWSTDGLLEAVVTLTNLQSLVLVNPMDWLRPDSFPALTQLHQLRSFGMCLSEATSRECFLGGGDYFLANHLARMGSRMWPLTSLKLLAIDADGSVVVPFGHVDETMVTFANNVGNALWSVAGTLQQLQLDMLVFPVHVFGVLALMPHLQDLSMRHCYTAANMFRSYNDVHDPHPLCCQGLQQLTGLTSLTIAAKAVEPPACRDELFQDRRFGRQTDVQAAYTAGVRPAKAQGWWSLAHASLTLQQIASLTVLKQLSLPLWELSAAELWNLVPLKELQHLTVAGFRRQEPQPACAVLQHCRSLARVTLGAGPGMQEHLLAEDVRSLAAPDRQLPGLDSLARPLALLQCA